MCDKEWGCPKCASQNVQDWSEGLYCQDISFGCQAETPDEAIECIEYLSCDGCEAGETIAFYCQDCYTYFREPAEIIDGRPVGGELGKFTDCITNAERVAKAIGFLREARELLKESGSVKTLARVRLALSSAKGAQRHADLEPIRLAERGV